MAPSRPPTRARMAAIASLPREGRAMQASPPMFCCCRRRTALDQSNPALGLSRARSIQTLASLVGASRAASIRGADRAQL
jgi:hypothetical protein